MISFYNKKELLAFLGWNVLIAGLAGMAIGSIVTGFNFGVSGVIAGMIGGWFWGTLAAICAVHIYLPGAAEWFSRFLILPSEKRTKPPVILSPVQGMIVGGKQIEALHELHKLREENPGDAGVILMMANLYFDRFQEVDRALEIIEQYLDGPHGIDHRDNITLLLRYSDGCLSRGEPERALRRIEQDIKKYPYHRTQKQSLLRRCYALNRAVAEQQREHTESSQHGIS